MTTLAQPPKELLRMEGVKKRFGATIALDGVDLTVRAAKYWRSWARTAVAIQ